MKYLCLVYQNEAEAATLDALTQCEYATILDELLNYRDSLKCRGHLIATEAVQPSLDAATIRVRNGLMSITLGPVAETSMQMAAFYLINATDLNDAIRVVSRMPPARTGCVEVRPIREFGCR